MTILKIIISSFKVVILCILNLTRWSRVCPKHVEDILYLWFRASCFIMVK